MAVAVNGSYSAESVGSVSSQAVTVTTIPDKSVVVVFGAAGNGGLLGTETVTTTNSLTVNRRVGGGYLAMFTYVNDTGNTISGEVFTLNGGPDVLTIMVEVLTGADITQIDNYISKLSTTTQTNIIWPMKVRGDGCMAITGYFSFSTNTTFTPSSGTTTDITRGTLGVGDTILVVRNTTAGGTPMGTIVTGGTFGTAIAGYWITFEAMNATGISASNYDM